MEQKKGKRKTGKAYRRMMTVRHQKERMRIVRRVYFSGAGYVDWDVVDGKFQPVGTYVKYPKNSNAQRYLKTCANRTVRRRKESFRGGQYRKCFDYQWNLY